jgi:Gpi18-like mannosyltransferase
MKKQLVKDNSAHLIFELSEFRFIVFIFLIWRSLLTIFAFFSSYLIPIRNGFIGPTKFANMDGIHYLSIAHSSYFQFEHAFFPLYPITIRFFGNLFHISYAQIAVYLSSIFFLFALLLWYRLLRMRFSIYISRWTIILITIFPTSIFFGAVYSESLFFFLSVTVLYLLVRSRWILACIVASFTSATRLFGILLLPMVYEYVSGNKKLSKKALYITSISVFIGLLVYMNYLYNKIGDPLAFFHAQPAFGAGRSGSSLILLPQVLYRYFRIFITVSTTNLDFWVALFELLIFLIAIITIYVGWKKRILTEGELWYVGLIVIIPSLTGTFSSIPRYILSAFPIFIVPAVILSKRWKILYSTVSSILWIICSVLYLQGYFIA